MPVVTAPVAIPSSLPPSGAAGGDLGGTYPNPTVDLMSGGTIAGALTVTSDADPAFLAQDTGGNHVELDHTRGALSHISTASGSGDTFRTQSAGGYMTMSGDGNVVIQASGGGSQWLQVLDQDGSHHMLLKTDGGAEFYASAGTPLKVRASGGSTIFQVGNTGALTSVVGKLLLAAGAVVIVQHAVPADGDIAAGDCALWFDQTDGVGLTKLMAKGKSADGTVKTATVAVLA